MTHTWACLHCGELYQDRPRKDTPVHCHDEPMYYLGLCNELPTGPFLQQTPPVSPASREEQHSTYLDCGPAAWDDR